MRVPSGVTDQVIYFVAVDATDFTSRETGLSSFTVYRARNGGSAAAMTTPTVAEVDASNMPGLYSLLLDEDMAIDAGDDSQEMAFHITHAGMAPVTRTIELYRPKITAGATLGVQTDGDLTKVNTLDGHTPQTGDGYALTSQLHGAFIIRRATAQAGAAGSITLDASASSVTNYYRNRWCVIVSGTGAGQVRNITAYNGTSKIATVEDNWATTPDSSSVFALVPSARVNIGQWLGTTPLALSSQRVQTNVAAIAGGAITAASIATDAITTAKIADGAITAAKLAANVITAAKFAADALSSTALSDAAVAKIEAALLNEGDGQALIDAIVQAIDDADIDTTLISTLVRDAILDRVLSGNHDTTGSVGKVLQDIAGDTNELQADWADDGRLDLILDELTTQGDANETKLDAVVGYIDTEVAAIINAVSTVDGKIDTVDTVVDANAAAIAALNDLSAAEILTTALTESYAANGAEFTLAQGIYAIHQMLMDFTIVSTSWRVRKIDGATTAFVVTLNDAADPTAMTRT